MRKGSRSTRDALRSIVAAVRPPTYAVVPAALGRVRENALDAVSRRLLRSRSPAVRSSVSTMINAVPPSGAIWGGATPATPAVAPESVRSCSTTAPSSARARFATTISGPLEPGPNPPPSGRMPVCRTPRVVAGVRDSEVRADERRGDNASMPTLPAVARPRCSAGPTGSSATSRRLGRVTVGMIRRRSSSSGIRSRRSTGRGTRASPGTGWWRRPSRPGPRPSPRPPSVHDRDPHREQAGHADHHCPAGHEDRAAGGVERRHGRRLRVEPGRAPLSEPGHHQQRVVDTHGDTQHRPENLREVGHVDDGCYSPTRLELTARPPIAMPSGSPAATTDPKMINRITAAATTRPFRCCRAPAARRAGRPFRLGRCGCRPFPLLRGGEQPLGVIHRHVPRGGYVEIQARHEGSPVRRDRGGRRVRVLDLRHVRHPGKPAEQCGSPLPAAVQATSSARTTTSTWSPACAGNRSSSSVWACPSRSRATRPSRGHRRTPPTGRARGRAQ